MKRLRAKASRSLVRGKSIVICAGVCVRLCVRVHVRTSHHNKHQHTTYTRARDDFNNTFTCCPLNDT